MITPQEFTCDDDDAAALILEENGGVITYSAETQAAIKEGERRSAELLANPPKRVDPNAYSAELTTAIREGGKKTMAMLEVNPQPGLDDETLAAITADQLSQ